MVRLDDAKRAIFSARSPPDGTTARGVQMFRFEDSKMVERWGSSDEPGVLRQLDAMNIRSGEQDGG